ncbi:MAG: hypothetical protein HY420_03900 [Candidatus Kerfeldbacteria bacterium]|nr:hypothetical protein [Candidatus Kerfeldbacteria bacterium]
METSFQKNRNPKNGQPLRSLEPTVPETMKLIQRYVSNIVTFDFMDKAYRFIRTFPGILKEQEQKLQSLPGLSRSYQDALDLARAVCFPMLTEDEAKTLFRSGIVMGLRNPDIDMVEKATSKLATLMFIEERNALREKLRFELRQNSERLTLQNISSTIGMTAPTVKLWLELAERVALAEEPLAAAITRDENFTKLGPSESGIVLRLLTLDDYLSISSESPEGFENPITIVDENGKKFVIEAGEVHPEVDEETEKIFKKYGFNFQPPVQKVQPAPLATEKTQDIRQSVKNIKQAHATADESRYAAQEKMLEEIGTDLDQAVSRMSNGLLVNDATTVLASLGVLSRSGAIDAAVRNSQLQNAFREEFIARLTAGQAPLLASAATFVRQHPDDVNVISAFVRWVIARVVSDEAESARIGSQIENTLAALGRPEFVGMTYFDVTKAGYRWTPLRLKPDGKLERVE